jgi:hypothetical protein
MYLALAALAVIGLPIAWGWGASVQDEKREERRRHYGERI